MRQAMITLFVFAALLAGCQSKPEPVAVTLDDAPLLTAAGQRRSLAFDSGHQRTLAAAEGIDESLTPWWADRADHPAATEAGYVGPIYLFSYRRTVDRQYNAFGEPRDYTSDTTYRGRIIEGVR